MMKTPSKVLVILLALMLTFGIAATASAETYKVWMPPFGTEDSLDKDFWETQLKPFAEENGIEITVEITPWSGYEEKYLTGISSGSGPDVGYMYVEMINDFINMGALLPMDDMITDADRDNYIYLDNGVFQGKQYMFPIVVGNPRMLVCNMEILKKAGLERAPQTWDEFIEYGLKIKEACPDVYPYLQSWGDTNVGNMNTLFYPYLWQAGGNIFNDDYTEITMNSAECVKAAQFLYDLRYKYGIMPDVVTSLAGADVNNAFLEGKVAMIDGASSFVSSRVAPAGMDWDYSIMKDAKQATFVAMDCLVIPSNTKNPEIAYKIIQYMTSGPVMTAFHQQLSTYPPVGKDEEYGDLEAFKAMYDSTEIDFNNYPAVAGFYKVNDLMYKNMQLLMLDQMTAEEVMQSAVDYYNSAVK